MDILTESQLILLETEKKQLFPLITLSSLHRKIRHLVGFY